MPANGRTGSASRDEGLVRRVGPWGLAASVICSVVGAGIFVVPAALAAALGAYAPGALLLCAIAIGAVAICFAEGGSRVPSSGGAYGYIEEAFGPMTGFVAGTILCMSNVLSSAGMAAAIADIAANLVLQPFKASTHLLVIIFAIAAIALVNLDGLASGMRLVNAATLLKLAPLAVFIVVGATAVHGSNLAEPATYQMAGFGRALILALFTFTGMEVSLCSSGEVAQPAQTIPRALLLALLVITVIYLLVQIIAQGILGPLLAKSPAPLADAMGSISSGLRLLMLAGTALSMLGFLSCDILASPRLVFAFARDGFLPAALTRLGRSSHVPYVAIVAYSTLAIVLAVSGTFAELAILATLSVAVVYILGCLAAWRLTQRGVAKAGAPLNFRFLRAASLVGVVSMSLLIALGSRQEIIGLLLLIVFSVGIYLLRFRSKLGIR